MGLTVNGWQFQENSSVSSPPESGKELNRRTLLIESPVDVKSKTMTIDLNGKFKSTEEINLGNAHLKIQVKNLAQDDCGETDCFM